MDLRYVQTLLVDEARQQLASLAVSRPIAKKASTIRELSGLFQGVGICRLLVDADPEKFRENLIRSAQARRYYLRRSHREGDLNQRFLGLSRTEAFLDAIVARAEDLKRDIATLSVEQWHEGWEYEDDFCYYVFLHHVAVGRDFAASEAAEKVLERFERALEGQSSTRLSLCRAFLKKDRLGLRSALEAFLDERRRYVEKKRPEMTEYTAQALFWPRSFVSIEALAWLVLLDDYGIDLGGTFEACPIEATELTGSLPPVEDFLESLDVALDQA